MINKIDMKKDYNIELFDIEYEYVDEYTPGSRACYVGGFRIIDLGDWLLDDIISNEIDKIWNDYDNIEIQSIIDNDVLWSGICKSE